MHLRTLFTCLTIALAVLSGSVMAQQQAPTRAELIEFIGQMPEFSKSREELARLGYEGERLNLAAEHGQKLYKDKVVAGYMADRLLALYNGNLPAGWAPEGLITPLFNNGYTNLSRSDRAFYYQVQLDLLKAMSARDCGLVIKGRMSERRLARTINQAETQLPAPTLKRYFQIQRTAVRTGVSRAPKALSPADSARIQELLNAKLRSRIESDPALKAAGSALDNMNRASAGNACQAGMLFYDVALSMKGRDLDHVLLYLNE